MSAQVVRPRRRINLRAPITGLVLIGIVAFGGYYGWQAAFGRSTTVVSATPTCSTSAPTTTATTSSASGTVSGSVATTSLPPTTPATPPTTPPVGTTVPPTTTSLFLMPSDVTVNVYNATIRRGLAINTAAILKDRGFVVADVDNDPLEEDIPEVAKIRAGTVDSPEVRLLIQHVPGATVVADGRTTRTVDLVLGDAFTALGPVEAVTPVPIASRRC